MIRKTAIVGALLWTLVVTCLRAARLPNNFSKEHWLIDYRFGLVKRGLVGSLLSTSTAILRTRPSETLINTLAVALFVMFCAVLLWVALHIVRRSLWSAESVVVVLVFLSSPFVVMSAHLIGYYDNIIVMLTIASIALALRGHGWAGAIVQSAAILVHETSFLIGLPVFCWCCWRASPPARGRSRLLPIALPVATFALLTLRLHTAPHRLERLLTAYLSTYPFVAASIADVRVPHWITITFADSYLLHQGHLQERILSQAMIALVVPSLVALLGFAFDTRRVRAVSLESTIMLGICLVPQSMHAVAWDTARIWTYAIVCAFLLMWVSVDLVPRERESLRPAAPFLVFFSMIALLMNAIAVTPLMDGVRERFEVMTRLLLYAPVLITAIVIARRSDQPAAAWREEPSGEHRQLA